MFCGKLKEFLSAHGVAYVDRDVSSDESAVAELSALGYLTTPVTKIDGELVIGFDRARLEALLQE
ncbi:MAG: glutaredoxin family protein [Candidatus Rokubacteria bacterium]|nr:glutaredoxin family protein [Candidatus Rokubacteria bacterium]